MAYTLVNVRTETHKAIKELANLLDMSMQDVTKLAVHHLATNPEVLSIIEQRVKQAAEAAYTKQLAKKLKEDANERK